MSATTLARPLRHRTDDPPGSANRLTIDEQAAQLLSAHHLDTPLLLANVWDAASAQIVEAAGLRFVATSSRAIAQVFGEPDDDSSDPDQIFSHISRIARSVSVPVTADLQAGFRLDPSELVERMLDAGVVGCNLEDTDHHGGGGLLDPFEQASYLEAVRAASQAAGVHVVLNARTDVYLRGSGDEHDQLHEAIQRGRLYHEAGADCVYPFSVTNRDHVESLIEAIPGPLNFVARRGRFSIGELTALGAQRISLASGIFHLVTARLDEIARSLAQGRDVDDL